jgi:hypothetical protein
MARPRSRRIKPWKKVEPDCVLVKPWPSDSYPECSWWVKPVKPRKRDFWKVLRGKYTPALKVGRTHNMRMTSDTLREVWSSSAIERELGKGPIFSHLAVRKIGR